MAALNLHRGSDVQQERVYTLTQQIRGTNQRSGSGKKLRIRLETSPKNESRSATSDK